MRYQSGGLIRVLLACSLLLTSAMTALADDLFGPDMRPASVIAIDSEFDKDEYHANFWNYQEMDEAEGSDYFTESMEWTLNATHKVATWLDSFFDDERVRDQQNVTRVKIAARAFYDQDEDNEYDLKFSIKAKLPKARERLQLFLTNDLDQDMDAATNAPPLPRDEQSQTFLGLRAFDVIGEKIPGNTSTAAGINLSGGKFNYFIEPRYSYTHNFTKWDLYFLQKIRYSRKDSWESRTRLDLDRILTEKFFFRFNTELYWQDENDDFDGFEHTLRFYLAQKLPGRQALVYELNNVMRTKPEYDLYSTSVVTRYRRQFWRKWMFFEVAPQVAFRRPVDYDPAFGILLKIELLMQKSR
jgi:hypothetical protein